MNKVFPLVVVLCSSTAAGADPGRANVERPNVLFIAVDDLRPRLGCYGVESIVSPNIDRLASGGVVFERSYCMVPTCGASRASLMTGLRPSRSRFVNYLARADEDAPGVATLNTHFKTSGYHTVSLGKVFHWREDSAPGWSEPAWRPKAPAYRDPENIRKQRRRSAESTPNKRRRGPPYESADVDDEAYGDGLIARRAVEDLERLSRRDEPFFLAVGFLKPHLPFVAPKKYWDLYDAEKIKLPRTYHRPRDAPDAAIHNFGELRAYAGVPAEGPLPDELARTLIHGYSACVSYTDAQIGRILDQLDRLDLAKNTIVVLWGDHGWNLGEHTLWCKHCTFETSMRAPLIVRAPGIDGGKTTRGLTEFIDIYPSLSELAGLPKPEHLEGTSFVPLLHNPSLEWKDAAIGRFRSGDTIRTDRHRFTEYTNARGEFLARMLYDHEVDPDEDVNVSEDAKNEKLVERLTEALREQKGVDFDWTTLFTKRVLTGEYYCDGITAGDINRDGQPDIVAGPFWYEGPTFEKSREIYPAKVFPTPPSPTDSMFSYVHDFNGDGWNDVLKLGRVHKHEAVWFENPQDTGGAWKRHFVFERVKGESPPFVDIDGDGKPELITHDGERWGWIAPDWSAPTEPWTFHPITAPATYNQFYHGTGVGDVNGDGRLDLLLNDGWWEQPTGAKDGNWKAHPFKFDEKGGAQMFAYDVDGDADNDIITSLDAHGWGLAWFEQLRDGSGAISFRRHLIMGDRSEEKTYGVAFSQPHALALADIDGDGLKDIVTGKRRWAHGPTGDIEPDAAPVVYWFRLTRKLGEVRYTPQFVDDGSGLGVQIAVTDVSGDGAPDILTASKLGSFLFTCRRGASPKDPAPTGPGSRGATGFVPPSRPTATVRRITSGPAHHFFGYIGQCRTIPWNASGRYIAALRTGFQDRMPSPEDAADVVLLDCENDYAARAIDQTLGWNPQQGTMMYWNPRAAETQLFFNDRDPATGKVFCVLYDVEKRRRLREYRFDDTPVGNGGVCQQGGRFAAINYGRIARLRPVTGYPGAHDWTTGRKHPADDGVFIVDVATGTKRLLASFKQMRDLLVESRPDVDEKELFINHTLWSRDGERLFFFARGDFGNREKRLNVPFVVRVDGTGLKPLPHHFGGHPEWDEGTRMLGRRGAAQAIYDVEREEYVGTLGDPSIFPKPEGDIALSPDGSWLVNGWGEDGANHYAFFRRSDGYAARSRGIDKGHWRDELRVDGAPCWNRDGTAVVAPGIASDGTRQMFLISLEPDRTSSTGAGSQGGSDRSGVPGKLAFTLHEIGHAGDKLGQTSLVDMDRDGDLDLVTGSRGGDVQWWEYRAADSWARHPIGASSPTDVGGVAFDVDGDGWIDQCSGSAWWRNPGEPWRGEFERFENGAISTHDNRVADVDGDGRLDLVSMRDAKGVFWYRVPDGIREEPTKRWIEHRVGDARHSGLAPADIDGDGDVDLVVASWWYENLDGDGARWRKHENIPFDGARYNEQGMATQNRVGDLDGDGDLDIAITDGETKDARAAWIENSDGKGGRWKAHELAKDRGALHSLAIEDFDGDGNLDIFTCEMAIGGSGRWFIYTGDGKGSFGERQIHEGVPGHESVVGDVDGDGDIDICSKPWNGSRHIYLENRLISESPRRSPRLLVLTDIGGDPDDLQSLIRLLVTSNELDIEGLIASASGTPGELGKNVVKPHLIREAVEAYGEVRESLAKHAEGFPPAESLLAVIKAGNPLRGVENIGEGKDTEGSRWIIDVVDRDDPRPVNITIWGGSTELAQALWRVREDRGPRGLARFIAKVRVHAIGHQDDTGPWILREFPGVWYTLDLSQDGNKHISAYRGMWKHGDRSLTTREWLVEHVQTKHGPLGALYPLKTWSPPEDAMKEGDTPSWFAFLENGLNVPSRPDQGGWGGRFRVEDGRFRDAMDTVGGETSRMATVWRWRRAYQNELEARMDWCVQPFDKANHAPAVAVDGAAGREVIVREVRPGEAVELTASARDVDGDSVRFRWYQYPEAGTYTGEIELAGDSTAACSITAPRTEGPATVHIILEAEDDGAPALTAYRRVVLRVAP